MPNKIFKFVRENILAVSDVTVNVSPRAEWKLPLKSIDSPSDPSVSEAEVTLTYGECANGSFVISARERGNTVVFSIDAKMEQHLGSYAAFTPENAVNISLGGECAGSGAREVKITASAHDGMWWMFPHFVSSFDSLPDRTQSALINMGKDHIHILPLTGDNFRCELDGSGLHLIPDMMSLSSLSGPFLAVTVTDDPFSAVNECYSDARALGAVRVPLRSERTMPSFARGFGWCTWDAFRHDVSAELIYEKLREFKEKKIPLKWMIIDDGWLMTKDERLCSFEPDPVKFPDGLGGCIRRIKDEFGVEQVGVWHAFTGGYWFGVAPGSALFDEQRENLVRTPAGLYLPSLDEEKAFRFWDSFHSKLREWGVDFVKIDNQSSASPYLAGSIPTAEGARICHRAIERSIVKNFDGDVINCMGMDMENVLSRPSSGLSRNSDDFFPGKRRGFVKHLVQNVYNAVWHGQLYHCDFDMWWSSHESAVQSGVLRAVSGSPIYVSDKIGESDPGHIMPAISGDGSVMLCDGPALPMRDCLYSDLTSCGGMLKIWNRSGENFVVAAFNLTENEITDSVDLSALPGLGGGEYAAVEYFSGSIRRVRCETKIPLTLCGDGTAVFSLYPIKRDAEGEYALMGESGKYAPIAGELHMVRL